MTARIPGDEVYHNPRSAIEAYLLAALTGKIDDAVAFAFADRAASDKEQVQELNALIEAKTVKIPTVWVGEKNGQAIAKSEQVKILEANPDGRDTGYLVFTLVKSQGKWLVDHIDFETEETALRDVEEFQTQNIDAKFLQINPKGCPVDTAN